MNKPLRKDADFGTALKLVPAPTDIDAGRLQRIRADASHLHQCAIILSATPRYPENEFLYQGRLTNFLAAAEDMRKALGNG